MRGGSAHTFGVLNCRLGNEWTLIARAYAIFFRLTQKPRAASHKRLCWLAGIRY